MASTWSQNIYITAYKFAAEAHWNSEIKQVAPGTDIPYLMHFSLVAMEVIVALENESGLDGNLAVQCALLHDTIEDTDTTYEQLVQKFGLAVGDGVHSLTKDESVGANLPKQQRKLRQMADSLERIRKQPKEIWMVKMADRITNLQPPPKHWTSDKIISYREEACEICVFITLPSAPGGSWGGVAGVQKLIGVRALRKLEQEESTRILKLAEKFIKSRGAAIAFQKNAWNSLRSATDPQYSIGVARAGGLKGTLKGRNDLALLCVATHSPS